MLGLRTRYTRSRPCLRIRTVCQLNVDISIIHLECDQFYLPHTLLVLPPRDFAVTLIRLSPRFIDPPPLYLVDRAVAQRFEHCLHVYLARTVPNAADRAF